MSLADDRTIIEMLGAKELRRAERAQRRRNFRIALFFMAPAVVLTSVVLLLPIAFNVYLSLTRWEKFKGLDQFAGLDNYQLLLNHPEIGTAFASTAIWVTASLIIPVGLGLLLALVLRGIPMEGVFKTIIFVPRVLASTSIGVIWFYVYAPHGLLNSALSIASGHQVDIGWLYTDDTTMPAIIATYVWQNVGLVMVLLLLGLAAIPTDPIEAARMDGASGRQVLQHIVLPLLTPTLLVVSMLSILAGFGTFDLLWVMGISYPGERTLSLSVYMYFVGFNQGFWAYSAAIAVFLGVISIAVTWIQALLQARAEQLRN